MSSCGPTLRVVVVDDSPTTRRLMVEILSRDPDLLVVAEAGSGEEAVRIATRHRPDLIVMDIAIRPMDGFDATRKIMEVMPTPIVLVSASFDGGDLKKSFEALEAGALTLVAKPGGPQTRGFAAEAAALTIVVKLMAEVKLVRRRAARSSDLALVPGQRSALARAHPRRTEIVAIAASTGGPAALAVLLGGLPKTTPVPILVVQHITAGFHQGLVDWLDSVSQVSVRLARDNDLLRAGEVLIAPPDSHLGVTDAGRVSLRSDPPIGGHRPSATYLFRSVAGVYGPAAVGAILTGMGNDGVTGLRALKGAGGLVLAQDEATSVVYGMPKEAVSIGIVDEVLPIDQMIGALISAWNGAE